MNLWPALFACALISCGNHPEPTKAAAAAPALTPAKQTQTARFDHLQHEHASVPCQNCHTRSAFRTNDTEPQRPGHHACAGCHSSENYLNPATTEPLCATCHPAQQILSVALKTQLLPFPRTLHQFGVSAFSHETHMKADARCETCHSGGTGVAAKSFPAHPECYSCHVHQAGEKLGRCEDCHAYTAKSVEFAHGEGLAGHNYNFHHAAHTKRKDGSPIACKTCHAATTTTTTAAANVSDILRMEPARGQQHHSTCWGTCHIQKDETRCGKCHVQGVPLPLRAG